MVRVAKRETSEEDVFQNKVTSFIRLKKTVADLTKEANALRDEISASVSEVGEEDETGSLWLHLPEEIEGIGALKRERRVSQTLNPDVAYEILSKAGLVERCYEMVPVLDEEELMQCLYEDLIDEEDLAAMYPTKVTWALVTPRK